MAKRIVRGSSIRLNSDIHISGNEVTVKGKKPKLWEDLEKPFPNSSESFTRALPYFMGSIPVMAGIPTKKDEFMLKLLGGIAVCADVEITSHGGAGYRVFYTNVLNRVRNRAKESLGGLSESDLKEEMYHVISEMLEKAGPAFVSWKAMLMDLMKNHGSEDFMKGVRSAVCAMTGMTD